MTPRPSFLPADRPWPPRRIEALPAVEGLVEIVGTLTHDAELRTGANGGRSVLIIEISTGLGFLYEAARIVPGTPEDLIAAEKLQHQLRRGAAVRVSAHGLLPRIDHGNAVLQLLEVATVSLL